MHRRQTDDTSAADSRYKWSQEEENNWAIKARHYKPVAAPNQNWSQGFLLLWQPGARVLNYLLLLPQFQIGHPWKVMTECPAETCMNGLASVFDSKIFQQTASKTYHPLCHIHSVSLGKDLYLDLKGLSLISSFHFSLSWDGWPVQWALNKKGVKKFYFTELEYMLNVRIYVDQRFAGKILGNRVWPQDSTEQSGNENVACKYLVKVGLGC